MLSCDGCGKPVRESARRAVVMVAPWSEPAAKPVDLGTVDLCDNCAPRVVKALQSVVNSAKRGGPGDFDGAAARNTAAPDAGGGGVLSAIIDGLGK